MSKSYGNSILIADDEETTAKKVRSMITDPQKIRRGDPGRPEICPRVLHSGVSVNPLRLDGVAAGVPARGALGCVQDKGRLRRAAQRAYLRPVRERYRAFRDDPAEVERIIEDGTARDTRRESLRGYSPR